VRPLLLDLFCGAGGAAMGYHDGVDSAPQPNYPYDFIQGDALEVMARLLRGEGVRAQSGRTYYLTDFSAIHASPPCQGYTGMRAVKADHPRLIEPTRELLEATGISYVIENVEGARAELRDPVTLQGRHFGLHVERKRLFETNWLLFAPTVVTERTHEFLVYEHGAWRWTQSVPVYGNGGRKAVEYWPFAMGVGSTWDDCWMTRAELAEAIPPRYAEFVGQQLRVEVAS
jgi:DNA (cytosine-5)-methyltransferase 1